MTKDQFDALVGRYVLLYQPDPPSTIRSLLRSVKPDGIVVFHEFDCPGLRASYPACPLFDQVNIAGGRGIPPWRCVCLWAAAGQDATRRGPTFPTMAAEIIVGG